MNTVRIEDTHSGRRIHLTGQITVYSAICFRDTVLAALPAQGDLEIDLAGVNEIDNAGLQIMLQLKNWLAERARFSNHSQAVRQILTLNRMAADFDDLVASSCGPKMAQRAFSRPLVEVAGIL